MPLPTNMHEAPLRTDEYTIYTKDELGVPGLNLFGHRLMIDASEPLIIMNMLSNLLLPRKENTSGQ